MTTAPFPDLPGRPATRQQAAARAAELFERHGRMVYGVCRAMLRDPHDAEDATQQTFLSAHRALLGSARVREPGAWLATIARNECRGRIAAGMRTPPPLADEDLEAIPARSDETERRLQADALRQAIAELPDRQREAVVLRDLYGLRYGEVAIALGLSRPATEALLFRARRAMRVRLRPVVGTVLTVPVAIRDDLAEAIPGFAAPPGSGAVGAGAAGGLLAKLTAGPLGVKVVTAAVAVSAVGAVGTVESERAAPDPSPVLAAPAQTEDATGTVGGTPIAGPEHWGMAATQDVSTHGQGGTVATTEDHTGVVSARGDGSGGSTDGDGSASGDTVSGADHGGSGGSSGDGGSEGSRPRNEDGGGDTSGSSGPSGTGAPTQPTTGEDTSGSSGSGSGSDSGSGEAAGTEDSGSSSSGPSADDARTSATGGTGDSGSGSSDSSGSSGDSGSGGSGSSSGSSSGSGDD